MISMLNQLTCLEPNNQWKVVKVSKKQKKIIQECGKKHRFANLKDLIQTLKFTNQMLASKEGKALSKEETARMVKPLTETASKLKVAVKRLPRLERTVLSILEFVSTGTTLSKATKKLQKTATQVHHVDNTFAAKLAHPKLMADAEIALKDFESYQRIGKNYTLPNVVKKAMGSPNYIFCCWNLTNPMLYHMRQAIVGEWKAIIKGLQEGKSIEDPEVMNHCDAAMQMCVLLTKLSLTHEMEALHRKVVNNEKFRTPPDMIEYIRSLDSKKEQLTHILADQKSYPYWILGTVGHFYMFLRSYPIYGVDPDKKGSKKMFLPGYKEHRGFIEEFYKEGTRASKWREQFNEFCNLVTTHIDKDILLKRDARFYIDKDTPELLDNPDSIVMGQHLKAKQSVKQLENYNLKSTW